MYNLKIYNLILRKEGCIIEGLAAVSAGVTNTYGNGDGQNVKHYYAGADVGKKTKKKKGK